MWENVRFSMNSTMPLFFVMLLGYVLYQKKFLSDAFVAGANKFVFYVALPVQLFRDLAATDVRTAFDGAYVLFCFVVTLVSCFCRTSALWASSCRCATARRQPFWEQPFCRASTARRRCPV